MKRVFVGAAVAAFLAASAVPALATNGYQLIGVGQMQMSMAGAVTAMPLDSMTAISNPAGMARVGERADFSMEAFMPSRYVDFSSFGGAKDRGGTELYGIPSVGWVANAFERDNFYFGGGMYATSGMGVDYNQVALGGGNQFEGYSAVQFWKMAPTVAWNQSDRLSFGVSLNVDYQSLTFDESINDGAGTVGYQLDLGRPTQQLGYGITLGALFDVNDMVSLGVNYISKQNFNDAKYRLGFGDVDTTMAGGGPLPAGNYKLGLDYPQQAAFGVAVKPTGKLMVDLDIKWINWSSTHDVVTLSTPGGPLPLTFGWDDQIVYALGAQYAASDRLKLRAGFNYGKSPIGSEDVMSNLIFPAVQESHVTLGADYLLGEHWGVGGAYMKAFSKDVTGVGDVPAPLQGAFGTADSGFKIGLEEQAVGILLYYLF